MLIRFYTMKKLSNKNSDIKKNNKALPNTITTNFNTKKDAT